jgi:FixJ family two-component response regulator
MTDIATVHIIDDDEEMRISLDSLLRSVGHRTQLYGSAKQFLDTAARSAEPSCLVVDVRMPGLGGLELQEQLAKGNIIIPIVLITGHGDIPMTVKAMKAGAIDFLTKPFRDQDMLDAVSTALEADRQQRSGHAEMAALRARYDLLSAREKQVMAMVATGLMNKQVAGKLELSEVTVKIHRGSAMKKMQAKTLADLIRMSDMLGASQDV